MILGLGSILTNSQITEYLCKAWVNFNGTGTVVIRASGNVTSITDNGVGDYTVNFTTAMLSVNYAVIGSGQYDVSAANPDSAKVGIYRATGAQATASCRIGSAQANGSAFDALTVCVAFFR